MNVIKEVQTSVFFFLKAKLRYELFFYYYLLLYFGLINSYSLRIWLLTLFYCLLLGTSTSDSFASGTCPLLYSLSFVFLFLFSLHVDFLSRCLYMH